MSAQTALRLAVRPLRGATFLDQFAAAAATRRPAQLSPLCLCYNPRTGGVRLFSTAPPPPRRPPPGYDEIVDTSAKSESETPVPKEEAPSTTTTTPLFEEAKQPEPEPAASSSSTEPLPSESSSPEHTFSEPSPSQSDSSSPSSSAESSQQPPSEPPSDPTPPPPPESDPPADNHPLPSFTETHRHPLSARFSTFMDNLQSRALTATQTLNDLTGYSAIEAIKAHNIQLEQSLHKAQQRLREARHNYKSLTSHRASTQREVTTLLARKDTWNPLDLERFTALYRADHELEAQVAEAAAELTEAETEETRLSSELTAGILKRYHEEQIWSDRIRRQSTWGTWGLMGVNVVLFLVLQFVAEPWRRKRLMRGIAEREEGVFEEVRRELEEVRAALEASGLRERAATEAAAAAKAAEEEADSVAFGEGQGEEGAAKAEMAIPLEEEEEDAVEEIERRPWKELLQEYWEDPELLKEAVNDLYSERRIAMKMRDVSIIALEGAAAGAAVAVVLAFSILRS
ncbi:hypothetical protein VTI74DRAFT_4487 [Chaetomium olivicolor]